MCPRSLIKKIIGHDAQKQFDIDKIMQQSKFGVRVLYKNERETPEAYWRKNKL